jgi:poly-gamma-glutamate synthesis protein (capsule biosynthesis protein)
MVHWSMECPPDPSARQQEAAGVAVEGGTVLVVGNHPHVVHAIEAFPTGFAGYALGNFVFDQDWS